VFPGLKIQVPALHAEFVWVGFNHNGTASIVRLGWIAVAGTFNIGVRLPNPVLL